MLDKKQTLGKKERLKSRKKIDALFRSGKSFAIFPLRVYYSRERVEAGREDVALQFGVGVSKRYFKKAVDRNRVKRLLRESFRKQKSALAELVAANAFQLSVFAIFTGRELPGQVDADLVMQQAIQKLSKLIQSRP